MTTILILITLYLIIGVIFQSHRESKLKKENPFYYRHLIDDREDYTVYSVSGVLFWVILIFGGDVPKL